MALVPAGVPVHRPPARATGDQRRAMLAAAVHGNPGFYVDDRELAGNGPGWTIDTLASFRAESEDRPLCLLLGADQLEVLDTWRRWRELTDYATWWWRVEPEPDGPEGRRSPGGWKLAGAGTPPDCTPGRPAPSS